MVRTEVTEDTFDMTIYSNDFETVENSYDWELEDIA